LDDTDFSIEAAQRKKLREFAWGIARTGLRSRRTAESFPVARKVESLIPGLDEAIHDMIEAFAGPSDRARREAIFRCSALRSSLLSQSQGPGTWLSAR